MSELRRTGSAFSGVDRQRSTSAAAGSRRRPFAGTSTRSACSRTPGPRMQWEQQLHAARWACSPPVTRLTSRTAEYAPGMQPHLELRAVLDEIVPRTANGGATPTSGTGLLEFQRELGARGWSAPAWPVEIGGRALGVEDQIACDAEFGRAAGAATHRGVRHEERRPHHRGRGHAGAEGGTCSASQRRGGVVPGLQRARRGQRPRRPRCRAVLEDDHFVVNGTRSGRRSACGPRTACCSCAPIRRARAPRHLRAARAARHARHHPPPDHAGHRRERLRRAGLRGRDRARRTRCSARSTADGGSRCRRSATSGPA